MAYAPKATQTLKALADIGVEPTMSPEDGQHIRILNIFIVASLPVVLVGIVYWSLRGRWVPEGATCIVTSGLALLTLVLNHRRLHTAARVHASLLFTAFVTVLCLTTGEGIVDHYYFIVLIAAYLLVYPSREKPLMVGMVLLALGCMLAMPVAYAHVGPLGDLALPPAEEVNPIIIGTTFGLLALDILISRFFMEGAEARLRDENGKVVRLSDKLRRYLPHQFVDAIIAGESGPDMGYRRRRLTILFSDIQGFTEWVDLTEPEEVPTILNQYLSDMSRIAHRHGGTIDKFIGDALMVFFGDPDFTSDRDHALRCVQMAIAMQDRMKQLRQQWDQQHTATQLHIRVGISTGEATVGSFGSQDRLNYTALGRTVNLAQRLEGACAPDGITVSHSTYELIRDEVLCEPRGAIQVKGFASPVQVFAVQAEHGPGERT